MSYPTAAQEGNEKLSTHSPILFSVLSETAKQLYFPAGGILAQAAEAQTARHNATIGQAFKEKEPLTIASLTSQFTVENSSLLYASSYGVLPLRKQWAQKINDEMPASQKNEQNRFFSNPIVTNGITHALHIASVLFQDDDDFVIMPEPFWGNYKLLFNGKIKTFSLFSDTLSFNNEGFEKELFNPGKKKIVLVNFPQNPSGYSLRHEEKKIFLQTILKACRAGKEIVCLVDDAYQGLVFDEAYTKESLFYDLAQLHEQCVAVKLDGLTKEAYAWGLRVGFITIGTPSLTSESAFVIEDKIAGYIRGTVSNISRLTQELALKTLTDNNYQQEKIAANEILAERYEKLYQLVAENPQYHSFFRLLPSAGAYFACVEVIETFDAQKIRVQLLENYGIGLVAIGSRILRIAFSSVEASSLHEILDALYEICQSSPKDSL